VARRKFRSRWARNSLRPGLLAMLRRGGNCAQNDRYYAFASAVTANFTRTERASRALLVRAGGGGMCEPVGSPVALCHIGNIELVGRNEREIEHRTGHPHGRRGATKGITMCRLCSGPVCQGQWAPSSVPMGSTLQLLYGRYEWLAGTGGVSGSGPEPFIGGTFRTGHPRHLACLPTQASAAGRAPRQTTRLRKGKRGRGRPAAPAAWLQRASSPPGR